MLRQELRYALRVLAKQPAFTAIVAGHAQALLIGSTSVNQINRARIIGFAERQRLPAIADEREFADIEDFIAREAHRYGRALTQPVHIVLYPQVAPSNTLPVNPQGCWDWWGYSGLNFQVRSGAQLSAVKKMVERLTAAP